ncbi:AsmA-like C-terminal region-containing protein [Paraflavitalea sp. CAU 1676]|uniref:AsmA family protein n=1 Tax=Paraflavitalea sp. CAU 1676 TaxID=3032598 RepID=UPI0023D98901|nr:AsmA-like C-terminal region-containing protein [Paraflavitalea sp. CAU 1676]MDF2191120.1 AsmA-like C-terminal region-containing protein [Paraflavitalea sp. CAU 1676]
MSSSFKRITIKLLKLGGISFGIAILLMFLLPYIFPGFVSNKIKDWARSSINSELDFSRARLSFFRHFPALTLTLYDLSLKGSAPFEKATLVNSEELSLGVNLMSLFTSQTSIDKVFLTGADINILVDSSGRANYNIYESGSKDTTLSTDSSSVALKIEKILIEKSQLVYNDQSVPMVINMKGLNYEGTGDLSKAIFDLHTHMVVDSLDFYYDGQPYVQSKKINADLITKINTNSLTLLFEQNDLKINKLPLRFNGIFEVLSSGYNMDFTLKSAESDLHDIFTGLPPDITQWLDKTDVRGHGDIDATLKGKYNADSSQMPDLALNVKIRNGYIAHASAPTPISNLFLNFQSKLPHLNTDSLQVTVDSIFFNIEKDYFSSVIRLKGLNTPTLYAKVASEMDLEKWDRALGFAPLDLKGKYKINLEADGMVARTVVPKGLRGTDTVLSSIPKFTLRSSLSNGYIKYKDLPQAVDHISFDLNASCPDHDYKHTSLAIENLNAQVLNNFIKGFFRMGNSKDFPINAELKSVFNLADIKHFYPLDSLSLAGNLDIDIQTNGKYIPAKKVFPVTTAKFSVQNGSIQTPYYPSPVEQIQVSALVSSKKGSMTDLAVDITPVSFRFEGQPFFMKADLKNFSNLRYNIASKGTLDIGKIYQVFAVKGYEVSGLIETNLALRGLQSDATAGHYDRLFNAGTMKVKDMVLRADLFPQPFFIRSGNFRFEQDKMWFNAFKVNYGKSQLTLDGYLSNVINYLMVKGSPLQGNFDLATNYFLVDEFMVFADDKSAPSAPATSGADGVVLVPTDLAVTFKANAKKVHYNGIDLNNFKGQVTIDSGAVKLQETGFELVGAPVVMNGSYKSISATKAQFDYHIDAKDFDVKRAYKEIKLFHDLVPAGANAEGIVSLDYQLAGRLNEHMMPVYPSLKGGGVLSVKKVKMKGWKLMNTVSKETEKEIADPDLSKVEIKSNILNNLITIDRTRVRVSPFRLRFEGQTSFDGKLNLKMRIGLPPFGIFGIPVHISGTQDKPVIKLRRGKDGQLEQTKDDDEADTTEQL